MLSIKKHEYFDGLLLIFLIVITSDMPFQLILPALPVIREYFGASVKLMGVAHTANFVSLALSSIIYGYTIDVFGRRRVMIFAFATMIVFSIAIVTVKTVVSFIVLRFLQGISEGVGLVLAYTLIRDMWNDDEHKLLCAVSYVKSLYSIIPLVSVLMGAVLVNYFSWRCVFIINTFLSGWALYMVLFSFEDKFVKPDDCSNSIYEVVKSYGRILLNANTLHYLSILIMTFSWLSASTTHLPLVFLEEYHVSYTTYTICFFMYTGFYLVSLFCVSNYFSKRFSSDSMIFIGLASIILGEGLFITCNFIFDNKLHPYVLEILWIPQAFGLSCLFATLMTELIGSVNSSDVGKMNGMISCMKLFIGGISIFIMSNLYDGRVMSISLFVLLCNVINIFLHMFFVGLYRRKDMVKQS
ncbi:MAG: major Facilitator Superfamily protein [Candidatus Xenolissoclinum pacificiensis L6]|uniref:Major Facilitator Superfamily protein n=1 Tax=Candidatus Xenolissoclinum pacificiensis L6 TaxID=1401685 RepID=W2V083_9RICK|nr:MAG: major Facilitator Superfamily protein [Candidatus Xenolissoclinum pacificiensis L6]